MKTLELKLKKDVLIVDAINEKEAFDAIFEIFNTKNISDYKFLCKGSGLTEEIASEFFEHDDFLNRFEAYIDTVPSIDKSALKLFIKIFESKGFYWLENPIEKPVGTSLNDSFFKMQLDYHLENKWQEAEEKTFRNPLIFVKK